VGREHISRLETKYNVEHMFRTHTSFTLLQAVSAVAALALVLWLAGAPHFRFAEAANVTTFSDTLSDSAPGQPSDHTISFVTTPSGGGVANGQTITLDFSDGPFVIGSVDYTDIDVATTSDYTIAADCSGSEQIGASFSGTILTIEFCSGNGASIPANATTTIRIGENATFGGAGDARLQNPSAGSYEINLTSGSSDVGETRVAIVPTVLVTASVDTSFTFTVDGLPAGTAINGTTTTGSSTAIAIPFGVLQAGVASTAAQQLSVSTNARNGFVVTVKTDGDFISTTGAVISSFIEGAYTDTPTPWQAPVPVIGDDNTYGHWGITTNDVSLGSGLTDLFQATSTGSNRYVAASTTPVEVFRHDSVADGQAAHVGRTQVGYQIQITALQEAAEDYEVRLTYVATPVF
jgi:hypothetical protein